MELLGAIDRNTKETQRDVNSVQRDVKSVQRDVKSVQRDVKSLQRDVKTVQRDVNSLIESNASNSKELRQINAELYVITDAIIASGHPDLRTVIDAK